MAEVRWMACARIPTARAEFCLHLFLDAQGKEHLALVLGNVRGMRRVLARIHSECFTGDVLGSQRCDCGEQLQRALDMIVAEGHGVLVYLRQEGRGIGLLEKLRAYNLQDQGYDTVDANLILGHQADERDYSVAAAILRELDVRSVRLLTNNPSKIEGLKGLGVEVIGRVPLVPTVTIQNVTYLRAKRLRLNHLIPVDLSADGMGQVASTNNDHGGPAG